VPQQQKHTSKTCGNAKFIYNKTIGENKSMATQAQLFTAKLEDAAFAVAFEAASATERQKLLDKAGLQIPLKEAEAIFAEMDGSLSEEDLERAAGGDAGITRPPADPGGLD
jgi:hypothetical protein